MSDLFGYDGTDIAAQLREVRREISLRERVYPQFVAAGKLTRKKSDQQIAVMKAVLLTLDGVKAALAIMLLTSLCGCLPQAAPAEIFLSVLGVFCGGIGLVAWGASRLLLREPPRRPPPC